MIRGYEQLNPAGFLFQTIAGKLDLLHADFGDGYRSAVRIGSSEGLRTWRVKIDVLPDLDDYKVAGDFGTQTRADYLHDFFMRSKARSNRPFWIHDPKDGKLYLAEFVDDEISYDVLCGRLYSTGLQLRQRRVAGVLSPIETSL